MPSSVPSFRCWSPLSLKPPEIITSLPQLLVNSKNMKDVVYHVLITIHRDWRVFLKLDADRSSGKAGSMLSTMSSSNANVGKLAWRVSQAAAQQEDRHRVGLPTAEDRRRAKLVVLTVKPFIKSGVRWKNSMCQTFMGSK